jgi:hypothetical protein
MITLFKSDMNNLRHHRAWDVLAGRHNLFCATVHGEPIKTWAC